MLMAKLAALAGAGAAAAAGIAAAGRFWLKVRHEYVESEKVTRPLRLLFFSDLHGRNRHRMNLDIWRTVEQLKGIDLTIVGGDFILRRAHEVLPHLDGIERLARRAPMFAVDGNHDNRDYRPLKRLLTERGVSMLNDRKLNLKLNGNSVDIVGLRDYMHLKRVKGFAEADTVMHSLSPDILNICVSHQPQILDRYSMCSADMFLCGHTHGGQVRFPFTPVLFAPNQGLFPKFGYGWYSQDGTAMFVSKGIGATHFPIRFWNRPEICVIDIIPREFWA